jgi:hypothetical protein
MRPFRHAILDRLRDAVLLHGVTRRRRAPRGVVRRRHRQVPLLDQLGDDAARGVVLVERVRQLVPYLRTKTPPVSTSCARGSVVD